LTAAATGEEETREGLPTSRVDGYVLGQLLGVIEKAGVAEEQELARLEWTWFQALEHTERGPATLYRGLANDAKFFAMLVGLIFRPRFPGRKDESCPEPDERTSRLLKISLFLRPIFIRGLSKCSCRPFEAGLPIDPPFTRASTSAIGPD
jgi:hypothetical protein